MGRGISAAVAAALMVLVVVAASVLLYLWVSASTGQTGRPPGLPALKIDTVEPVRAAGGRCVYFKVYIRNTGSAPAVIEGNSSGYLVGAGGVAGLRAAPLRDYRLAPGSSLVLRLVPSREVVRPSLLRVVAAGDVEAAAGVGGCRVSPAGVVLSLPAVDGYRVAEELPGGLLVESWVEYVGSSGGVALYRVWYNVSIPAGVTLDYGRAEIFTINGSHPLWAAPPVAETAGAIEGPNWWSNYWTPVREDEFPVTVVVSLDYRAG